jgi:hypothetical protein
MIEQFDIHRAALDARLYRIAARKLRADAREARNQGFPQHAQRVLANARKCDKHAREAEQRIIAAANAFITAHEGRTQ